MQFQVASVKKNKLDDIPSVAGVPLLKIVWFQGYKFSTSV
jgi:hypothetical protein